MKATTDKRKKTRTRIKEVGAKFFMENGVSNTMIVDIANEVKLDRRTIYRYYPSKEHLLIDICTDLWKEFAQKLLAVTYENQKTGFEKVKHLFEVYIGLLKESPDMILFLGMIDTSIGRNLYNIPTYKPLDEYGKKTDRLLAGLIKEGQEDGTIKKWFEPLEYAVTINNSIVALANRIAIYLPNVLIQGEGYTWTLLMNQVKIFIDSMEDKS